MVYWLHRNLRDRRNDWRASCGSSGRFQVHESLFLVAHFHNVIIGGVLFGAFAGVTYWFPKAFGFRLHEGWGKAAFWFAFVGFYVTFMPLYVAGLLGMTRRLQHYDFELWRPWC